MAFPGRGVIRVFNQENLGAGPTADRIEYFQRPASIHMAWRKETFRGYANSVELLRRFLPQRRNALPRFYGFSLRLCAFAPLREKTSLIAEVQKGLDQLD